MRRRRRPAALVALATVLLAALLVLRPFSPQSSLALWVLLLAAIVLVELVRGTQAGGRRPHGATRFEQALSPRPAEQRRPHELDRLEREIVLSAGNAAHAYRRLLPRLRAAATARLAVGHGVGFERRPEVARSLLGEHAWELLRPDRPPPEDRNAPGISLPHIEALVDRIEAL